MNFSDLNVNNQKKVFALAKRLHPGPAGAVVWAERCSAPPWLWQAGLKGLWRVAERPVEADVRQLGCRKRAVWRHIISFKKKNKIKLVGGKGNKTTCTSFQGASPTAWRHCSPPRQFRKSHNAIDS